MMWAMEHCSYSERCEQCHNALCWQGEWVTEYYTKIEARVY